MPVSVSTNDMSLPPTDSVDPTVMPDAAAPADTEAPEPPENETAQVTKILKTIRSDIAFFADDFKQMRRDMFMAYHGFDEMEWSDKLYKTNIAGRHVKQKTNSLYAKNPKATAARNERLDFTVWDENPKSLMLAFQITQQAQMAMAQAAQMTAASPPDPITGMQVPVQPQLPQGFEDAQKIIADFQQGTAYRQMVDKVGKTLEILFAKALREQKPLNFKMAAKALVRRACTCGVSYIELGFIREVGPAPDITAQLADARARLGHMQRLMEEAVEGEIDPDDAEMFELQKAVETLQSQPEIVLREGLIFDFPQSTKVIPDQLTTQLIGFVGAQHLTIQYLFTCEQVEEMFPESTIRAGGYKGYGSNGQSLDGPQQPELPLWNEDSDDTGETNRTDINGKGLVSVFKYYDKLSGMVYYVADGHKCFLRPPAPPDVFVDDFWPVYALTFNAAENEKKLFPKSDVALLHDAAMEHNRSRQGLREHREAARPRFAVSKGLVDEEARDALKKAKAFDVIEVNKDGQTKLADVMEVIPTPGVDPNLYETNQFDEDRQLSVGSSDANYGGITKATATESTIAANATQQSDESSKDDLDDFLSVVARASSQIFFGEMSEEQVKVIVGPGAVWPTQTLAQIANEMYLEVEAGSSGRPNQAVEIENFTKIAPILMQIPGLDTVELAKEGVRRLGDKLDVNKFILANAPSIVAQNSQKQPATGNAQTDPAQQGLQGGNNAPQPPGQPGEGTGPAFGSNQVDRPAL